MSAFSPESLMEDNQLKPRGVKAKIQKLIQKENLRTDLIKERKNLQKNIEYGLDGHEIKFIIDNYRESFETKKPISLDNNMFEKCDDETVFLLFKQFRKKYSEQKGSAFWKYTYTDHYARLYKNTTGQEAPSLSNNIPIEFKKGLLDNYVKRELIENIPTEQILTQFDIQLDEPSEIILK